MAYFHSFHHGTTQLATADVHSRMFLAGHVHGVSGGTVACVSHTLYAVPYYSSRGGFADRIALQVQTARASSFARLIIFGIESLSTYYPRGMLLVSSVATATTGLKTVSIAASLEVGTLYWLGMVSNANISVVMVNKDRAYPTMGYDPVSCFPRAMLIASCDASSVPPYFPESATAAGSDMPAIGFRYVTTYP